MSGPLVGGLVNKFGCRPVCILGSLISCLGLCLSTLSPNVPVLMLTYGVIGGLGLGLIYLPSVIAVGYYFESKRALATGISVCGSGVGTFLFAPLATKLLDAYGWKGANLIFAGLCLNCAVFGALMRPLELKAKIVMPEDVDVILEEDELLELEDEEGPFTFHAADKYSIVVNKVYNNNLLHGRMINTYGGVVRRPTPTLCSHKTTANYV
jgi:MFS family permease